MSANLPPVTSPPWGATTKRLVGVGVVVGLILVFRHVAAVTWYAIVVASVLAYLLSPVVTFFERRMTRIQRKETRRTLSVFLSWLVVIGMFALVIGLIVPATVKQLRQLAEDLPNQVAQTQDDLKATLGRPITIGSYTLVPWDELEKMLSQDNGGPNLSSTLQDWVLSLANPALGFLGGAVSFVITIFFVLTMLFYLMRDGPTFVAYIVGIAPESYQGDMRRLIAELGLIWNAYLRGQVVLCLAMGLVTYLAALALGLPQPLLLGLLAGFLEFIPNLGPTIASIPALLFALTADSGTLPGLHAGFLFALVVALTYVMLQQLEAIFLVPRILGHSLDLHPFVVLVAILIGASLGGLLGIILAAPGAATLRLFLRYLRVKLLDEDVLLGMPGPETRQNGLAYRMLRYFVDRRFPLAAESTDGPSQVIRSVDTARDGTREKSRAVQPFDPRR